MRSTEIVVIGGGVEGCSVAYHLAKGAAAVTLLEKHDLAAGASGASAGGVRHQGRDPREFPLAFRAIARWRTLEDDLGADLRYRRQGHVTLIEDEVDVPALAASVASQAAAGLDIRLVAGDDLRALAPGISPNVIAGAYSPHDGHADPTLTTRAFAAAAERHGAVVRTGTTVTALTTSGGRITGVATDRGPVAADVVVLAAGAWSAGLAARIGISLPLEPLGLQAMTTAPAPLALRQVLGSVRRLISLKQLPDGRYLLGGGWPGRFSIAAPRGTVLAESVIGNVAEAVAIFPPVAAATVERAWLGVEAIAADEVPILGPIPGQAGLVVAAGFSGHGFALSPAVGEAIANLILTDVLPPEIAALTFARFGQKPTDPAVVRQRAG